MYIKGYFLAIGVVALTTLFLLPLKGRFDASSIGLIYLLMVSLIASIGGTRPALISAITGFLTWEFFFIPPIHTFRIHSSQDFFMFLVFLVIGTVVGQITGTMRMREEESRNRERETGALYKAILAANVKTSTDEVLMTLAEEARKVTGATGCAFLQKEDGMPFQETGSGERSFLSSGEGISMMEWAMKENKAVGLCAAPPGHEGERLLWPSVVSWERARKGKSERYDILIPMASPGKISGLFYALPEGDHPFTSSQARILVALASSAAAFLERQRLMEEAARAESLHEAERIKSVLLSSISHNLKTPLSSLKATVSNLGQEDIEWDRKSLKEQVSLMSEDIDRLTEHIENLLNITHIESGAWKPKLEALELSEVISVACRPITESEYKRISINLPDNLPLIKADAVQMAQAIHHIVENALDYSLPGSAVTISARPDIDVLLLFVDDEGPGIPEDEREKIFEKFYRGRAATERGIRGTGLGLAICREIIRAHNGTVTAGQSAAGGARFTIMLPVQK